MKVSDLQQHVTDLGRLLKAAGVATAVSGDLATIGAGLQPFRELSLKDFADFLHRADGFTKGDAPAVPLKDKKPAPKGGKKVAGPKPDEVALSAEAKRLYDNAAGPTTTLEMIDSLAARLTSLGVAALNVVAKNVGLSLPTKTPKPRIIAAVKGMILDRKGSKQRVDLNLYQPQTSPISVGAPSSQPEDRVSEFDPAETTP